MRERERGLCIVVCSNRWNCLVNIASKAALHEQKVHFMSYLLVTCIATDVSSIVRNITTKTHWVRY